MDSEGQLPWIPSAEAATRLSLNPLINGASLIIGPLPNGAGLLSRRDEVNFVMQFCCLPMFALLALIYGRGGCSGSEHFMLSRLR